MVMRRASSWFVVSSFGHLLFSWLVAFVRKWCRWWMVDVREEWGEGREVMVRCVVVYVTLLMLVLSARITGAGHEWVSTN